MPKDRSPATAAFPRHIAWVSTWDVRCGIAEYSRFLLAEWPAEDRPITLLGDHRTSAGETHLGLNVIASCPCWAVGDDHSLDELFRALELQKPDTLIVQHQPGLITWSGLQRLLEFTRRQSLPSLVTLHNVQHLLEQPDVEAVAAALGTARHVLVHTHSDRLRLASLGLGANVVVFPHGAPGQLIPTVPARRITEADTEILIGAYGFMLPHKGFLELVRAVGALQASWPSIRLRMVTAQYPIPESESYLQACRDAAATFPALELEWHTDYLPNAESMDLLRDCDLVVLPYLETTESASGALRNAMASRAPVMVSPIAFFDEAGEAVLRASARTAEALANSIRTALLDLPARRKVKRNALRWLRARDWTAMSRRLHALSTFAPS
ncbi:glycosyltransferase [Frateuria aurantia]